MSMSMLFMLCPLLAQRCNAANTNTNTNNNNKDSADGRTVSPLCICIPCSREEPSKTFRLTASALTFQRRTAFCMFPNPSVL
jgi:hypothetical protein